MTMGLVVLGIMAVLLLFSFGRNAFAGLGLPAWAAFATIVAFAVGIVVPLVPAGAGFAISVGGFMLPIIAMFALLAVLKKEHSVFRGVAGMLTIIAITTALLLVMPAYSFWTRALTIWVIGLISGAVAFLVSGTRGASVFAVLGGIAVGDLIYTLIRYYVYGAAVTLGGSTVYNAMFLAALLALCLAQIAVIVGKTAGNNRTVRGRGNLNYEAGKDEDVFDRFDDELF